MLLINKPAIDAVRKKYPRAMEQITIYDDLTDLVSHARALMGAGEMQARNDGAWSGDKNTAQAIEATEHGDLSQAAKSDEMLERFEHLLHVETKRFKIVDAVAGGAPNVPAYLAGQPLAMRRRERISDDQAPLTVIIDTTSSASIDAQQMTRRGIAVLALVRAFAMRRPVKLYAAATLGAHGNPNGYRILVPIEAAPLDMARASYIITHVSFARALSYPLIYAIAKELLPAWPYGDNHLARSTENETYKEFFGGDVFSVTAPFGKELILNEPVKWLEQTLEQFGMKQAA